MLFGGFGRRVVVFRPLFGDFGALFGGIGWPIGAHRVDQDPLHGATRRDRREGNSVLGP